MTAPEWLDSVKRDARFAARGFRHAPVFTVVVVLSLALGIGANAAIFSALHALLLRPLPFVQPERLMAVSLSRAGNPARSAPPSDDVVWSYPKFAMLRDAQHVFTDVGLYSADPVTAGGNGGAAERVDGEVIGGRYFETLGVRPLRGRLFAPEETERVGARPAVLVGEGLWQRRFNADPSVLGKVLDVDGKPHTIIGVMPSTFTGLSGRAEVWMPIAAEFPGELSQAWDLSFSAVARLAPGVTAAQAGAAVKTIGARINVATPYPVGHEEWGAATRPLDATRVDPTVRRSLVVLSFAVALVLIITCANVAGLLLVRAKRREREIAMRLALGAGRGRLVRQLVTESLLLSLMGGVAALGVAAIGARMIERLDPAATLRIQNVRGLGVVSFAHIRVDVATLLVAAGLTIAAAFLFGLVPAVHATRAVLVDTIKGGRSAASAWRVRGLSGAGVLSVVEVALAVVLLAGSGLMFRSLRNLLAVDPGFDASHVLTMRVNLLADSAVASRSANYYERLLTRASAVPGVAGAALASCPPLNGGCNGTWAEFLDRPPVPDADQPVVGVHWVTPGWFSVARVPLVRGRDFGAGDDAKGRRAVIVSQLAAKRFWPGQDPIGRPLRVGQGGFGKDTGWVVGIVGDVRYRSLDAEVAPDFYLPYAQSPRPAAVVFLRTTADPNAIRTAAERTAREVNPNIPAFDVRTMEERAGDATSQTRFGASLLAMFAVVALLLATLGIYGVISSSVASRMREIGVRVALGATRSDVMRLAVARGALVATLGTALGVALAFWATRALSALLFGVTPSDPRTFAATVLLLAATTVIAAIAPARRAARADPMVVLRQE